MVATRHLSMRNGDVLLLIGTTKGAFLLRSDAKRSRWEVGGPYLPGHSVYAMAYDGRHGRLWMSTGITTYRGVQALHFTLAPR